MQVLVYNTLRAVVASTASVCFLTLGCGVFTTSNQTPPKSDLAIPPEMVGSWQVHNHNSGYVGRFTVDSDGRLKRTRSFIQIEGWLTYKGPDLRGRHVVCVSWGSDINDQIYLWLTKTSDGWLLQEKDDLDTNNGLRLEPK